MKCIFKSVAAIATLLVAFSACENIELISDVPVTHTVKFTSEPLGSKTEMSIEGNAVKFSWSNDDISRLTIKENGVAGEIDTENSKIENGKLIVFATFAGPETEDEKEYTAVLNGSVNNQTPRSKSYDANADVLVSLPVKTSPSDGIMFQFRRVVAINEMVLCDLPAGATVSKVTINSDKPICGSYIGSEWTETGNAIELSGNWDVPADGKIDLFYTTIPVTDATFTVNATVGSDSYLKKFNGTLTTTAGNVKGYSVGLKKQTTITVTENFNAVNAASNQYSCVSDITTTGNNEGLDYEWVADGSVYVFKNGIRLCSSSSTGSVTNSSILGAIPTGTEFTVKVYAAVWRTDGSKLSVSYAKGESVVKDCGNTAISSTGSMYSPSDFASSTDFTFTKVDGENGDLLAIASNASGKRLLIDKVEVIYYGDAPSVINADDIANVATAGVTNQSFQFSTTNVSGNPAVSCDGTVVTLASVEGNTVTFSVSANTTYKAREGFITITIGEYGKTITVSQNALVPEYDHDGTASDPYTISDALLKISTLDAEKQSEEVYITGAISSIESFSEKYGSITYVLGSGNQTIKIYGGLDFNGDKFANQNDLIVNQTVVVCGKLEEYNGNGEMASNSKLVSVNGKDYLLKSISVSGAKTQFDQGDDFSREGAVVKAQYRGNKVETEVTANASFDGYNGTTLGQQTITVSYTENGITKTTSYDITVADATEYNIIIRDYETSKGAVIVTSEGYPVSKSKAGKNILVEVEPQDDYVVDEFKVNNVAQPLTKNSYEFVMPNEAVTITVTFKDKPAGYSLVSSVNDIVDGDYVIAAKVGGKYYAMGNTFGKKIDGTEIVVTNGTIDGIIGETYNVELTKSDDGVTIKSGSSYLKYSSSTDLGASADKYYWSISIGTKGTFRVASETSGRALVYRAGTTNQFGGYSASNVTSTGTEYFDVELFKMGGGSTPDPIVSEKLVMSSVSCSNQTSNSLTFTWSDVTNASGYQVSLDGGNNWQSTQTETSYTWSGLSASTTKTLYVKAIGDGVNYLDSDPVNAEGTTGATGGVVKKYTAVITVDNIDKAGSGSGYTLYNGNHKVTATAEDGATKDMTFTSSSVMPGTSSNAGKMQFQASKGVISGSSWGTIESISADKALTVTKNGGDFSVAKTTSGAGYYNSITVVFTAE